MDLFDEEVTCTSRNTCKKEREGEKLTYANSCSDIQKSNINNDEVIEETTDQSDAESANTFSRDFLIDSIGEKSVL